MFLFFVKFFVFITILIFPLKASDENYNSFDGIWFTCEFAKSQSPPNDDCNMFDDEGFSVEGGFVTYLRILGSSEKNCKGMKKGHCFNRNLKKIKVKTRKIGKINFKQNFLKVSWLGCSQKYKMLNSQDYYTLIPNKKRCFWASKKHFYISRFEGEIIF